MHCAMHWNWQNVEKTWLPCAVINGIVEWRRYKYTKLQKIRGIFVQHEQQKHFISLHCSLLSLAPSTAIIVLVLAVKLQRNPSFLSLLNVSKRCEDDWVINGVELVPAIFNQKQKSNIIHYSVNGYNYW